MRLTPIYTEKSMDQAKNGLFSFWVLPQFSKNQIKQKIEEIFDVKVKDIKTQNYKKETKKNFRGKTKVVKAKKKVLVTLKSGKIELFETESSKK